MLKGSDTESWSETGSVTETYPCVFERPLVHLSSLLLKLLDDTLVNATKLVDQVTGGGGLAGVDMSNDHNVQMSLFLTHGVCCICSKIHKLCERCGH